MAAAPQEVPPNQLREAIRMVLERPEFAEPPAWNKVLLDIMNGVKDWLERLTGWSEANPALARTVFIAASVILLACLIHLLYLALADTLPFRRKNEAARITKARHEILEGTATDWREALQVARAKLVDGDLKRAIWIAHRVMLGLLDEQGALRFAGWKTNSHYLREFASTHPWHKAFVALTAIYDEAVYAGRTGSTEHVAELVAQIARLCEEAGANS